MTDVLMGHPSAACATVWLSSATSKVIEFSIAETCLEGDQTTIVK